MYDLWHVLAADDSDARQATRTATAIANKRVKDRFGKFLATDTKARFEHVKDEIEAVVTAAAEEYDADPKPILAAILSSLTPAKTIEPRTAAVVEARKPKLCPYHNEVVDISLAEGSPRAGFDAMAQHAWGPKHCKGDDYDGGKCNFKREFVTQSFWDDKAEKAEQRRQERDEQRAEDLVVDEITEDEPELITDEAPILPVEEAEDNVIDVDFGGEAEDSAVGEGAPEELAVAASTDAPFPGKVAGTCASCGAPTGPDGSCPSCGYGAGQQQGAPLTASEKLSEALETVNPNKADALKINRDHKRPSGPEDTEGDGSPHPTKTVDITEPIVFENEESPFEGTDAVSEKQDVTKADAAQKGKGGTFPSGTHADPVTSALLKEALTARDFVAIAHILATAPGGPDPQLAEHFAQYLANTNPAFDYERFIAAAGGTPQTGRDNYRDQYGPAAVPPPPNIDDVSTLGAVADPHTNPVREILLEDDGFLSDEVVASVAQRS